jgi:hypothetical protein
MRQRCGLAGATGGRTRRGLGWGHCSGGGDAARRRFRGQVRRLVDRSGLRIDIDAVTLAGRGSGQWHGVISSGLRAAALR